MPPSQQLAVPSTSQPRKAVFKVNLAIARANMHSPFMSRDRPVGVAAFVMGGAEPQPFWMAGYAEADDMARAAILHHLLQLPEYREVELEVCSAGLRDILGHVPGARNRGGLTTSKKRFKGYDVYEPVEAAWIEGRWHFINPDFAPAYLYHNGADALAASALDIALGLAGDFVNHRADHPDWWMICTGRAAKPHGESYERG